MPRGIVILIDQFIIVISVCTAFLLRFNFHFQEVLAYNPIPGILLCALAAFVSTLTTKSYAGIVRYTGIQDGLRIIRTEFLSVGIIVLVNLIHYYNNGRNVIPFSVVFISFFISSLLLYQYRLLVKNLFTFYKSDTGSAVPVIIFGAGVAGFLTKQAIEADTNTYKLVAFIDDDPKKNGKDINGTKIYGVDKLPELVKKHGVKKLVIAIKKLSVDKKNEIVDKALNYHVRVSYVMSFDKWLRNEWDVKEIRDINIEDLLGREVIKLNNGAIENELSGKVICITGAAGSIGSELARQVLNFAPHTLILIDQAESPLYEIERELMSKGKGLTKLTVFVADICNKNRINRIFGEFKPEIVFHAAAYKHVPMMENNPSEAVTVNIFGTKNLADAAVKHRVRKFVMISTDKAVNPTNVMGCTKRIAEIYVQSLSRHLENLSLGKTSFVTTRFGNVLGSNGSVIPVFKDQIMKGGPITVTHPEITRFFMTIPEACELVIEAGVMGQGGEIFIFDMGKPVKVYDLARKMVMLSGKELNKDIEIVFTGLRDGEKLYEELLNDQENTIPTHNDKILKAKVSEYLYDEVCQNLELLEDFINDRNEHKMVTLMKEIVPEYKSNYSRFEVLDIRN